MFKVSRASDNFCTLKLSQQLVCFTYIYKLDQQSMNVVAYVTPNYRNKGANLTL